MYTILGDLPDGHGAENVEKDKAAVGHVVPGQVTVADALIKIWDVFGHSLISKRWRKMQKRQKI